MRSPRMCDRTNSPHKRFFFFFSFLMHIFIPLPATPYLDVCVRFTVRSELSRKQYFLPLYTFLSPYMQVPRILLILSLDLLRALIISYTCVCVVNMHNYSAARICRCHKTLRPHLLRSVKFNNTAHFSPPRTIFKSVK